MALKKIKELSSGATCEYWKIITVKQGFLDDNIEVFVGGYLNEETRFNGKEPLSIQEFNFNIAGDTNRSLLYEKLKESVIINDIETNFFADAINC